MSAHGDPELARLVAALPDTYQKIHGAPEYDSRAMRDCDGRWALLAGLLDAYPKPAAEVSVLDVGCAQGYFSLMAAERGCRVRGIDASAPNAALCRRLAERAGTGALFEHRAFDESFVAALPDGGLDFVFLFSVIHHVCHERGSAETARLVSLLARKTKVLVAELALNEEPLYWARSLPDDPESLLEGFAFRKRLTDWPTHLSPVRRPVYLASGSLCHVDGRFFPFVTVQERSHDFVGELHRGSRRYFLGDGVLVKEYRLDSVLAAANRVEAERERAFLTEHGGRLPGVPRLLAFEADASRIRLARGLKEGELLSGRIAQGRPYDARRAVRDVLRELEALEARGLYHEDLRTWNVLLGPDGSAGLIDFGAVGTRRPPDAFDAFLTFCYCAANATQPDVPESLTTRLSAGWFPESWKRFVLAVTAIPASELSFRRIRETFDSQEETMADINELQVRANAENIMRLEERLNSLIQAFPPHQITAKDFAATLARWDAVLRDIQDGLRRAEGDVDRLKRSPVLRFLYKAYRLFAGVRRRVTRPPD